MPEISDYEIMPYGDSAFLVQFGAQTYSDKVTSHIHGLIHSLKDHDYWEEVVPGYNSLLAYFCPARFKPYEAKKALIKGLKDPVPASKTTAKTIEIPVCYGGEFGPDMETIMDSSGLSQQQIIDLHSAAPYKVCMMGFIPGFTFLSEAPQALHHARRSTPRAIVPAGSVGIAGWQTGIYGLESPGGWQLIGRTPLDMFEKGRETPFLVHAGDAVKFTPITAQDYAKLDKRTS